MKKNFARGVLLSTATYLIPAATLALLVPEAAQAQTVCTVSLLGVITCVDPLLPTPVTGTVTTGTTVLSGSGIVGSSPTTIVANLTGNITTTGANQPALVLITPGALTVTDTGTLVTTGANSDAAQLTGGTVAASLNILRTSGILSRGANVTSTSGALGLAVNSVTTLGDGSTAALLRSTGNVTFSSATLLSTTGVGAPAIDIATNPAVCITLTGGCRITTTANQVSTANLNSPGALILAQGPTSITIGSLTTSGAQSPGLNVATDPAACVIIGAGNCGTAFNIGTLTTQGIGSTGALITAAGPTSATVGTLSTSGANAGGLSLITNPTACVVVGAGSCATSFNVGNLTTQGTGATGVLVRAAGPTSGTINTLQTSGDQAPGLVLSTDPAACIILGTGKCGTAFNVGTLTTQGIGSTGALVTASGPTSATVGTLRTTGANALGLSLVTDPTACIIVGAGRCGTNFSVGNLSTQGAGATGVLVQAAGPTSGQIGTVQTAGMGANGIDISAAPAVCIILGVGGCNVSLTPVAGTPGNVTTTGANSAAVLVNAPGQITTNLGAISTGGNNSPGVSLITNPAACLIIGAGACTINDRTGAVTTGGNNSPGTVVRGAEDSITVVVGPTSTTGSNSPGIDVAGTGLIAVTAGPVTTAGGASAGIIITGDNDPVTLNCSSVTTLGADSPAVAISAIGAITVRCGALSTTGPRSDGLQIVGGAGPIDAIVASVITRGLDSDGVQVSGTGSITLNTGNVTTGGDGSTGVLVGGGAGPIVAICGDVVTTGPNSPGVDVAGTGAINVNCRSVTTAGINSDGINVVGGAGPVTVTSGPIRTVGGNSPGIDVTSTTGAQVITVGGVNVTGPGSDAIRAVASGCANININATSAIVSAQGTGILASTLCSVVITTQIGAPVSGALAGINATSGTGTTITLNDAVSSSAGPAVDANGASAVININAAGSITGRIDLTDNNDTVNNAGRFNVVGMSNFGGGTDVFNNLAGGTVSSTAGAGVLANCETFNNAGTITMINGVATNTLSICGNYVGSGAANLGIDVGGGTGGLTADRLIIGGNAGGSTGVNLALLAGSAVIDPDGVLIVDAVTATGTPFTLLGQTNFGLINYSLLQTGADTFLVSRADRAIFDVATLNNFAQELWHQSASASQACAASRRNDFGVDRTSPISLCGQLYGGEDRVGDNNRSSTAFGTTLTFSDRLKTKRRGAQVELGLRAGGNFTVGATAGYGHAEANLASGSHIDAEGHNYGLFAQFGTASGIYAGVLAKRDNYDVRFGNGAIIPIVRPDVRSTGIDGEVGFRTPSFGPMLDLNAGLSYVRTRIDDFTTGNIAFDNERITSVRGRIGARLGWAGNLAPFVDAKLFHEFRGNSDVRIASGGLTDTIGGRSRGTWGRVEAGFGGGAGGGALVSVWTDLGDVKGWGLRAGFRF